MNDERIEETLDREDIQIASLDKRFFAFIVDALLIATLASIINIETIVQLNTQGFRDTIQALNAIPMLFLQIFALGFFYQGLFTFWYGCIWSIGGCSSLTVDYDWIGHCSHPNCGDNLF